MSDATKYRNFLVDLTPLILERAREAKNAKSRAVRGSAQHEYEAGRLMAYNEIVSILQQQADGFAIPLSELGLDKIDPDRDLL